MDLLGSGDNEVKHFMRKLQYWVSVYRPHGFDHSAALDAAARQEIDKLNDEMAAAGVRLFVGGLYPASAAKSVTLTSDGTFVTADGNYLTAGSYVDGFWILRCQDIEEALAWGRKAAAACRASVEVRPFYG